MSNSSLQLSELTIKLIDLVKNTGAFIRAEIGKVTAEDIEIKAKNSLVSYVDQQAEKMLVTDLKKLIPNSGFITEEDTINDDSKEYTWIIDPLDGTTNFLHAIPHFAISIALQHKKELLIGVIYHVMADEMYYAWKNGGAFMNGQAINNSQESDFSQAILATGFPYATNYDKKPYFQMMEVIMTQARGMRRFGSAALDMAYVANGRFDAFYETSLNPWDVAGGIVICKEAKCFVGDYFGTENYFAGTSIIVGAPKIGQHLQSLTSDFFKNTPLAKY